MYWTKQEIIFFEHDQVLQILEIGQYFRTETNHSTPG